MKYSGDGESVPPIDISEWFHWKNPSDFANKDLPGVYLLARFKNGNPPNIMADPLDPHIVYIRETGRKLSKRWHEFHRGAFEGRRGHSGATTYRMSRYSQAEDAPYVAAMSSENRDIPLNSAWIKFVERKLILGFVKNHGRVPDCNKE